ncbi:MAG: DNA mismatch repair endonuclease MutL [Flavobacteriales bacterium]
MSQHIYLLPDNIANQIAAGEVIQRPASVVKELLENAVDAQASQIDLLVKDSGKTLIQVVDNGKGMSETDARLCFDRHATSKIKTAEDLFNLSTNGFRGEALASIASIAQVELQSKTADLSLGTKLVIEGSKTLSQEPIACADGSNFKVKRLFYNVPARRNFLKTDRTEFRFIQDEFVRVALAYPHIGFSLTHNSKTLYQLKASNLKQRIVALFGKAMESKLVPIEEKTELATIQGFIIKPEFAKKSRGEQFFIVNDRFIKNHYLNHAISKALEGHLKDQHYPSYFVHISVPPTSIDVNIHPTKTEIKFENETFIYSILKACIKKSLGQFNIVPSIDFDTNQDYDVSPLLNNPSALPTHPSLSNDPNFNPFDLENSSTKANRTSGEAYHFSSKSKPSETQSGSDWKRFLDLQPLAQNGSKEDRQLFDNQDIKSDSLVFQLHKKYILTPVKSGFILINQNRAHQRILFEHHLAAIQKTTALSQQVLFPIDLRLSPDDQLIFEELKPAIEGLGFDFLIDDKQGISIKGIPFESDEAQIKALIEDVIQHHKHQTETPTDLSVLMAKHYAKHMSIKTGETLNSTKMSELIDQLFACQNSTLDPNGKSIHHTWTLNDIEAKLN